MKVMQCSQNHIATSRFGGYFAGMKVWLGSAVILLAGYHISASKACVWDSKTLLEEKWQHPKLADAILHPKPEIIDTNELNARILSLKGAPATNSAAWWNDLAGAYLRLGQPAEAAKLLEAVTNQFANDYGIHANLGTAYHLLGRYQDAEREIRRDTELNTNAHFGLEKYHLALLQYLSQSHEYQIRHVYVEEFTYGFCSSPVHNPGKSKAELEPLRQDYSMSESECKELEEDFAKSTNQSLTTNFSANEKLLWAELALNDPFPGYMTRWDLSRDPQLDDGVIYMANLNPKEPACQVMLGIIAVKHWDINLAKQAFENAIQLGSPQAPLLRSHLEYLGKYHPTIFGISLGLLAPLTAIILAILLYAFLKWGGYRKRRTSRVAV